MSLISFCIALLTAFYASHYIVRRYLRQGKSLEFCLNLGVLAFAAIFATLLWTLPSHWSLPRMPTSQTFIETAKVAEQGDVKAQYNLGMMYSLGEAVARDKTQAVYWTRKSAEQGYSEAQVALGNMYINGEYQQQGIPKDYQQGKALIRKAAEQGNVWAKMLLYNMEYQEKHRE